jgi:hypothetical protein
MSRRMSRMMRDGPAGAEEEEEEEEDIEKKT